MLDTYLAILEEAYFEAGEAFKGLADAHVWTRPAPSLLSIGEIAGHMAYWEAVRFAGEGGEPPDLSKCKVTSLLVDSRFAYYTSTLESSPSEKQLAMSAEQVHRELVRGHNEAMAYLKAANPDLDSTPPGWNAHWTYRGSLSYTSFHIAYHTGQIYTVRHLLGDQTIDN